jgi:hypothetical protein
MYQCAISDEGREMLVLALVDLLFQDTQRHRLLDDVVIVGDIPLVYTSLEKSGRIVATAMLMDDQPSWRGTVGRENPNQKKEKEKEKGKGKETRTPLLCRRRWP